MPQLRDQASVDSVTVLEAAALVADQPHPGLRPLLAGRPPLSGDVDLHLRNGRAVRCHVEKKKEADGLHLVIVDREGRIACRQGVGQLASLVIPDAQADGPGGQLAESLLIACLGQLRRSGSHERVDEGVRVVGQTAAQLGARP